MRRLTVTVPWPGWRAGKGSAGDCLRFLVPRIDAMATRMPSVPPRPLAPGDVVAAFCEALGEWAAAQVTDLDPRQETAGVLDLDWSGPEPASVSDLGRPAALRLKIGRASCRERV